jgi:hypothetical protein
MSSRDAYVRPQALQSSSLPALYLGRQERHTNSGSCTDLGTTYSVDHLPLTLFSYTMEGFGLPMSFGKKSKAAPVNMQAKLEQSKRADEVSFSL